MGYGDVVVAPREFKRIPLGDAVDTYLDECAAKVQAKRLSPRTVDNYRRDLGQFVSLVGEKVIADDVDHKMVDKAIAAFSADRDHRFNDPSRKGDRPGRGDGATVRFWESVHRFFREAERLGFVQLSPMPDAAMQPARPDRGSLRAARTAMSLEQAADLLRHGVAPDDPKGRPHERHAERDRLILHLLAVCGPRVSELCSADTTDLGPSSDGYRWRIIGKGRHARTIPLSPMLSEMVDSYLAQRPPARTKAAEKALLLTGRGNRLAPRDVQRLLAQATARVATQTGKIEREVTPHGLRHTAATSMLASGWDVKVVAQMCGHASIATTGLYLDELPGELAKAIASAPLMTANAPSKDR